jgi:hypothetical protein
MTIRRVFTSDPGQAELLSVGGLVIIDQAPPATPLGAGTGLAMIVGEFERGPLETPTEMATAASLFSTFGGFGWAVGDNPHAGPVAQQSGGSEPWNGSGFIALANKTFNRLAVVRVDNSAGVVELERLACLTGGIGPFAGDNGDAVTFELDGGGSTSTITLECAPATITGSGVVFPIAAIGGDTLIASWDDQDPMTVTFTDTDLSLANFVARINQRFAATIAADDGGDLALSSVREGALARIRIHGGTALASLGLPTAVVLDLWTITVTADTAIDTQLTVNKIVDGVATAYITEEITGAVGSILLKRNALLAALQALAVPGHTFAASGADAITCTGAANEVLIPVTGIAETQGGAELTTANTTPGVQLEVYGTGNVGDSQNISTEEAANLIDAAANLSAGLDADGNLRACNELTPATGTLQAISGDLATAFGFDITVVADAADAADVTIPAGTRFQDETSVATIWVALEDVATGTGGGPFELKVRPFTDTDTAEASSAGDVTVILDTLPDGFAASNPSAITRLSAAQLDARYITAIQGTNVDDPPASDANLIFSARTSTAIRRELVLNCLAATAAGLSGRRTVVRPRIGVTIAAAQTANAELRDERKQFAFPAMRTAINEIRTVGTIGGVGFTDDGTIDVGADSFLVAYRTIILPEASAAQPPSTTNYGPLNVLGLESAYDPGTAGSTRLDVNSYKLFKRSGIVAARVDRTLGTGWNDDVTSSLTIGRTAANRRAFADFINDSLFGIAAPYRARIITPDVKRSLDAVIRKFLNGLLSVAQPNASRIRGYDVRDITDPSVPELLRMAVAVTMYATADVIAIETTVGPTVLTSQESIGTAA